MEDVKVREMQIFDYKKKIAEAETKLKQQQVSAEAVSLLKKKDLYMEIGSICFEICAFVSRIYTKLCVVTGICTART